GADDRAVQKIVKGVADEHQRGGGAVNLALVGVAVSQQDELFEHEEDQDAGEQGAKDRLRRQLGERFRQQREQRHAQQGAHGIADQPRHQLGPDGRRKKEKRGGDEQTAAATEKAQAERGREQTHATFYFGLRIS